MKKTVVSFLLLSCLIVGFQCTEDTEPIVSELSIAGDWTITEASNDDELQPVWENKVITFSQIKADSGIYSFTTTPDETIWAPTGHWKASATLSNGITVNDTISITYVTTSSKMLMYFIITDKNNSNCDTQPCLPIVLGNWSFELHRSQ